MPIYTNKVLIFFTLFLLSCVTAVPEGLDRFNGNGSIWNTVSNCHQFSLRPDASMSLWPDFLGFDFTSSSSILKDDNFTIAGAGYSIPNSTPACTFALFNDTLNASPSGNLIDMNVSRTHGFIASALYELIEYQHDNTIVNRYPLWNMTWKYLSFNYDHRPSHNESYFYSTTFSAGNAFTIYLTFVYASSLGRLLVSDVAVVTPITLTTVFQVDNYPYRSRRNHLSLSLLVGSGPINNITTHSIYTQGSMYFYSSSLFNATAFQLNDSFWSNRHMNILNQLIEKYEANATASLVRIKFKAGNKQILSIFMMGYGDPIEWVNFMFYLWVIAIIGGGFFLLLLIMVVINTKIKRINLRRDYHRTI